MPNVSSFGTHTDNAVVHGTITDKNMIIPEIPPQGLMSIGPRVTPNFVSPREWNADTTYQFFDAVKDHKGASYVAIKPTVPSGTPLSDTEYWFLWADPNAAFDDLKYTVTTYDQRITAAEESIKKLGDELSDRVDAAIDDIDEKIESGKQNVMLSFGDSYGEGEDKWPDMLSQTLGLKLNNFNLGGATWPLASKLDDAIEYYEQHPLEKPKIKMAVAYCGINTTVNKLQTAEPIIEFAKRFNDNFPDVQLYIAPLNNCAYDNVNFPNAWLNTLNSAPSVYRELRLTSAAKFTLMEHSYNYCTGGTSYELYAPDRLHPNRRGSAVIARNMASEITGTNTNYISARVVGTTSDVSNYNPNLSYFTNEGIVLSGFTVQLEPNQSKRIYIHRDNHIGFNTATRLMSDNNNVTVTIKNDAANPQIAITCSSNANSTETAIVPTQFVPFNY